MAAKKVIATSDLVIKSITNKVRTKNGTILYTVVLENDTTVLLSGITNLLIGSPVFGTEADPQERDGVSVPMWIMCSHTAESTTMDYQDKKEDAEILGFGKRFSAVVNSVKVEAGNISASEVYAAYLADKKSRVKV